ncbi:MAG: CDP-alcohol phosphatidyltransferase family protein [Aestuariivirgaceae bacterium]|jgi:cardiolipin synthase (CMP-forming)
MSVPNLLTIARILMVPLLIWLIISGNFRFAFAIFVVAGITDAVDGFIAKNYDSVTELGAYLDPLADKLLLVSIYVALGLQGFLPDWLVILVVSRDVMIVGAVILSWLVDKPVRMQPLFLSKANTTVQITLAAAIIGALAFAEPHPVLILWGSIIVGFLTVASGAQYMVNWIAHMAGNGQNRDTSW